MLINMNYQGGIQYVWMPSYCKITSWFLTPINPLTHCQSERYLAKKKLNNWADKRGTIPIDREKWKED